MKTLFLSVITITCLATAVVGCATDPQVVREREIEQAKTEIESVDREADQILAQARKDIALANALLKKTEHLGARVKGHPIRNVADVYRDEAIRFRSAATRYARLSATAAYIARNNDDPAVKEKWTQRASEYASKARRLLQIARHHADLAAHPEKVAAEFAGTRE